jgi:AraC-like DNA-binding protein
MHSPPPPSLDTWTSIFLIIAAQGFFTGIILWLNPRSDHKANRFLAAILFLFALSMIEYVLFWTRYSVHFPAFSNISIAFPFLYGVLLYSYFRQLFIKTPFKWTYLLHFLPFIIDFAFWLPFYLTRGADRYNILKAIPNGYTHIIWLKMAHMGLYAYLSWCLVENFAGLDRIKAWGKRVILFFIAFILSFITYFLLVKMPFFNPNWDYAISFAMSAFIGLVAVYGYIQPEVFKGMTANLETIFTPLSKKYQNSTLTTAAAESLCLSLQTLMQKEKLYKDNDLRLEKLADRLGANKHHVSQVINEHLGGNFFDYINNLRVEEAKNLLLNTDKNTMNIIEIAYEVGFNNKVTFNNTFKNRTGMTPTDFRKQRKNDL